jgi:hypothetical protein
MSDFQASIQLWVAIVQSVSAVALLIVTVWYVRLTERISRASERAAEAARQSTQLSHEALLEMRAQRFSSSQPVLIGELDGYMNYNGVPQKVEMKITNVGSGPALGVAVELSLGGVVFSLDDGKRVMLVAAHSLITSGVVTFSAAHSQLDLLVKEKRDMIPGQLSVSYADIHGRQFTAVTEMSAYPDKNRFLAGTCRVRTHDHSPSPEGAEAGYALDLP